MTSGKCTADIYFSGVKRQSGCGQTSRLNQPLCFYFLLFFNSYILCGGDGDAFPGSTNIIFEMPKNILTKYCIFFHSGLIVIFLRIVSLFVQEKSAFSSLQAQKIDVLVATPAPKSL